MLSCDGVAYGFLDEGAATESNNGRWSFEDGVDNAFSFIVTKDILAMATENMLDGHAVTLFYDGIAIDERHGDDGAEFFSYGRFSTSHHAHEDNDMLFEAGHALLTGFLCVQGYGPSCIPWRFVSI